MASPQDGPHRIETRRRLGPGGRKALLTVHIMTAVGLLGVDFTVLALGIAGWRGADPVTVYPAAYLLVRWLLLPLALLSWLAGIALGLLTPWGLVRHWWVSIKLALNTVGLVLGTFVLTPALRAAADAATVGERLSSGEETELIQDPTGATVVLTISVLLAIFKPFGRLRGRTQRREHT